MKLFATYLPQRPWLASLGLVALTIAALFGIRNLRLDPSNAQLFLQQSEAYRVYQRFITRFGSDETILVALHHPKRSLLAPEGIAAVRALTQSLAALPHVASVSSLANAPDMAQFKLTVLGPSVPRLIRQDTLTPDRIARIRRNPLIIGTLLSGDIHTAGILVQPEDSRDQPERLNLLIASIRQVAAQHATGDWQTYVAGTPLERHDVSAFLARDQQVIVPLVFLLLLALLYGIYRTVRLTLIPLGCVLLSLAWTMGLVGFAGASLNTITSLLPPVIMVVGVSAAIHLLNQFIAALQRGATNADAVADAVHQVGIACLLTSLTTAMGFFSLLVSPVPAVRAFAFFAGGGVLLSFVATMIFVPLALSHGRPIARERLGALQRGLIDNTLTRLLRGVAVHYRAICIGSGVVLIACLPGIAQLTEGTDIVRALKRDAPLRLSSEFIDRHLTGVNSLELMLQLPATDANYAPETIQTILDFSSWLRTLPEITAVHSAWEPLRLTTAAQPGHEAQLSLFATLIPLAVPAQPWLDRESHVLRLSARVIAMGSDQFLALTQRVQQHAKATQLEAAVTGTNYLLAEMSRSLVHTQLRSLLLAVGLILGAITLSLRSWRLGALAAIPNLLPPLIIFGLMGWLGIALSTATTMIASVSLGLIVDDTIHMLYRYDLRRRAGSTVPDAITDAIRHTGRALIITTMVLSLGFWAGTLGSLKPTLHFSLLTGLTLVLALLADLLLMPAVLLAWARQFQLYRRGF